MWEVMRRIWKDDPEADITGEALDKALQTDLTVISVYGGDEETPGSYSLDPKTSGSWGSSSTRTARSPRWRSSTSAAPTTAV